MRTRTRRPTRSFRGRARRGGRKISRWYADLRQNRRIEPTILRNLMMLQDFLTHTQAGIYTRHGWYASSIYRVDYQNPLGNPVSVAKYQDMYDRFKLSRVNNATFNFSYQNLSPSPIRIYVIASYTEPFNLSGDVRASDLRLLPGFLKFVDIPGFGSGGNSNKRIKVRLNIQKWIRRLLYPNSIPTATATSGLWATVNAHPADSLFCTVFVTSFDDNPAHPFNYSYSVDVTYDVTWATLANTVANYATGLNPEGATATPDGAGSTGPQI